MNKSGKLTKLGASYELSFSHDGSRLVSIGRNVAVWDAIKRKKIAWSHPFSHPSHAAFSPDGRYLAVKNTSGRIVILSADTAETVFDFCNKRDGEGSNVAYSPCGQYIVDGTWQGRLVARHAGTGQIEFSQDFSGEMIKEVRPLKSGNAKWLVRHGIVATTRDKPPPPNYFTMWDWPFQKNRCEQLKLRVSFIIATALSPDCELIAVRHGAPPTNLSIFEISTGACLKQIQISRGGGSGYSVDWSSDGKIIGVIEKGSIAFYDYPNLNLVCAVEMVYPSDVTFSPDSNLVALGSWQKSRLIDFGDILPSSVTA